MLIEQQRKVENKNIKLKLNDLITNCEKKAEFQSYSTFKWDEADEIIDGVYVGGIGSSRNRKFLIRSGITHILTVAEKIHPSFPELCIYKIISIKDEEGEDLSPFFVEAKKFIDEAKEMGGKVLVHCHAGASWSPSLVIAYMMLTYHLSLDVCLDFVIQRRSIVAPNFSFLSQLSLLSPSSNNNNNDNNDNVDDDINNDNGDKNNNNNNVYIEDGN